MSRGTVVPPAPAAAALDPLTMTWPAGTAMWRVHKAAYPPDSFNPDPVSAGRFRPFKSGRKAVPTAYVAEDFDAAVSESVFHELDPRETDQVVPRSAVYGFVRSVLSPGRDLTLIDLRGAGLRRLRLRSEDLIDTHPDTYPDTALWGRAFYACSVKPDGIAWSSRLHPGTTAAIIFGTRVKKLTFDYEQTKPLWQGEGFTELLAVAERANVTIAF